MSARIDESTACAAGLHDLAQLAGDAPSEPGRYARQLAAIESQLSRRRSHRTAAVLGGGLLVAAMVLVAVFWLRIDARTNVSEVPERYEAPASGEVDRSGGRAQRQRARREQGRAIVHDRPPPAEAEDAEDGETLAPAREHVRDATDPPRREQSAPTPEPGAALVDARTLLQRANGARAERRAEDARRTLLELRRRFPGDPAAEHATFLLGRVEHELARDRAAADEWFARYVAEYPDGQFAAAARGRLLRSKTRQGSDMTQARAAASDYLAHHPDGSYAELARRTLAPDP